MTWKYCSSVGEMVRTVASAALTAPPVSSDLGTILGSSLMPTANGGRRSSSLPLSRSDTNACKAQMRHPTTEAETRWAGQFRTFLNSS